MPEPQFPAMLGLFNVILLMRLAHDAIPVIWTYYTMLKFDWSPAQVDYSLMVRRRPQSVAGSAGHHTQAFGSAANRAIRLTNSGGISVARPVSAEMNTKTCFTLMRTSP
jgi:hypothetical protein